MPTRRTPGRGAVVALWEPVALVVAAVLVYLPGLRGGFIIDDDAMLTANPLISAAHGLRQIWFTVQPADYWPVTSTTLWLEWRLWGANPLGYHVTNLVLHCLEVLLL